MDTDKRRCRVLDTRSSTRSVVFEVERSNRFKAIDMISTFLGDEEWYEYVAQAKTEQSALPKEPFWARMFGTNKNDFYISLVVFVISNLLAQVSFLSTGKLSDMPYVTGVIGYFLGLLLRPGLDLVCILCALNALRDQNISSDDRYIFNAWLIFMGLCYFAQSCLGPYEYWI